MFKYFLLCSEFYILHNFYHSLTLLSSLLGIIVSYPFSVITFKYQGAVTDSWFFLDVVTICICLQWIEEIFVSVSSFLSKSFADI